MKYTLILVSLFSVFALHSLEKQEQKSSPIANLNNTTKQSKFFCPCPACLVLGQADKPYTWKTGVRFGALIIVAALVEGLPVLHYNAC